MLGASTGNLSNKAFAGSVGSKSKGVARPAKSALAEFEKTSRRFRPGDPQTSSLSWKLLCSCEFNDEDNDPSYRYCCRPLLFPFVANADVSDDRGDRDTKRDRVVCRVCACSAEIVVDEQQH